MKTIIVLIHYLLHVAYLHEIITQYLTNKNDYYVQTF